MTFFKVPFADFIELDSLSRFHQQITEKRTHLTNAQNAYEQSLKLLKGFQHKISLALEQLNSLDQDLAISEDISEVQELMIKKQQYRQFIENSDQRLRPFVQRLTHLGQDIHTLEQDIKHLEEQASVLTHQAQP